MKTKLWAIFLMIACALMTSTAQVLYKFGADKLKFDLISIISNFQIIGGIALYALGSILVILALKGGEVTVLYPIVTSSYVWVTLASGYFFKESINLFRWLGVVSIVIGIILITLGQKNKEVIKFEEPV